MDNELNINEEPQQGAPGDPCEKKRQGGCGGCCSRGKLHSFNYLEDIPGGYADDDMVEVNFKNTRKGFYLNSGKIPLEIGDIVAVEASPGHDIGVVTLTGALVRLNMRKANVKPDAEVRRVFRKAKASDIERYEAARAREQETMIRARQIAADLKLNMKIGDVEFQGDGNKAIFYYIADERVDFRQLIKVLADAFKVRIEMKQIGARQEAGRIGGIGPCGRPLCCSTWLTNFVSVSTAAARFQDISLNPQKLAGQCAKLKCCLNYEVDAYVEASKKLPPKDVKLETQDGLYHYFKADIFRGEITYSTDRNIPANLVTISAARAFEVIAMNKAGEKPAELSEKPKEEKKPSEYADILGQDSLTRFDNAKKKKKKKKPAAQSADSADAPKSNQSNQPKEPKEPKEPKGQKEGQPRENQPRDKQPRDKQKGQPGQPPKGQPGQQPKGQPNQQQPKGPRPNGGQPREKGQQPKPANPNGQQQKGQQQKGQQSKGQQKPKGPRPPKPPRQDPDAAPQAPAKTPW